MKGAAIVAFALLGSPALAQQTDDRTPKIACALTANKDFLTRDLALLQSSTPPSVETIIARRRLAEEYCLKFATCLFGDDALEPKGYRFSAAFSSCLDDEEKAD